MSSPEYPAPERENTPDDLSDLTRFLIPDSPAALGPLTAPAAPAAIPSTAQLLAAWEAQQTSAALVRQTTPAEAATGPLVPRWVWRASAVTLAVSAMAALVAFVVWGIALALGAAAHAVSAATHAASAAAPYLGAAVVAVMLLVLLCRKRPQGEALSVSVSQTVNVSTRRK